MNLHSTRKDEIKILELKNCKYGNKEQKNEPYEEIIIKDMWNSEFYVNPMPLNFKSIRQSKSGISQKTEPDSRVCCLFKLCRMWFKTIFTIDVGFDNDERVVIFVSDFSQKFWKHRQFFIYI